MSTIKIVLDTTVGETGNTQTADDSFIMKDVPVRFSITTAIATGDTIVIEGKSRSIDTFQIIGTFTDNSSLDAFLSPFWRVRRSVDGGVGDTSVTVHTPNNLKVIEHV